MSTEDIALTRMSFGLAQPTIGEADDRARLQAGIDATMRQSIAERAYNPVQREAMPKVGVMGAPLVTAGAPLVRGTGWSEPRPLALPPGQDVIERLVNAAQPHGSESPLRRPREAK
jgi:hypothetical protein